MSTLDDWDMSPAKTFWEDHRPEVHLVPNYAQDRAGHGRWCHLFTRDGELGILWTDDGNGLGIITARGASVAALVSSLQEAFALGSPATVVFDAHAAWGSQGHWAGPVERGDLGAL